MTVEQQTAAAPDWQAALDSQLVQRLVRPLISPGVIDRGRVTAVRAPADHAISRSVLMTELAQRHSSVERHLGNQPPIVLAQRLPRAEAGETTTPAAARELPRVIARTLPAAARPTAASTTPPATIARRIDPASSPDRPVVSATSRGVSLPSTPLPVALPVMPGSAGGTIARAAAGTLPPGARPAAALPVVQANVASAIQRVPATPTGAAVMRAGVPTPSMPSTSPTTARAVVAPLASETRRTPAATRSIIRAETRPTGTIVQRAVEPGFTRGSPPVQPAMSTPGSAPPAIQRSADLPVVVARSVTGTHSTEQISRAIDSSVGGDMPLDSSTTPASSTSEQHGTTIQEQPPVDTDALVETVLRKLSRQLAVEQERRGLQRWP